MCNIILASASKARRGILEEFFKDLRVVVSNIVEDNSYFSSKEQLVMALSFEKAMDVATKFPNDTIISADTLVFCEGKRYGKPVDREDAFNMLSAFSGKAQEVISGFSIVNLSKNFKVVDYDISRVYFKNLSSDMINHYLDNESYLEKAGAYGIQNVEDEFIEKIEGSFDNIVGIPTEMVLHYLEVLNGKV